ncbi:ABC transporter ATP-binding protein [Microbacterium sp. 22303]|uniref:ABC transporter ATP-binding protein n=1 Tax=Microbacterium sp. 22303 TaxID=3453905 RepID=UPI003F82F021
MTGAALSVHGATVRFGSLVALNGVDLEVAPGSIHAVIGPNGAGKSTLFNVISGVYRAAEGSVSLDGRRLTGMRPHRIAALGIGRSFQNVGAAGRESVREALMVGRHHLMRTGIGATMLQFPAARKNEDRQLDRVVEIAAYVGISDDLDRPVRTLPYGRQKLVDVARAVCMEPRLLMLDEPAAGLDPAETAEMTALIRDLRDALDLTVLLIEHDMGLVMSISDHVTVLDFGRRISDGSPDRVRADPAVAHAYLGVGDEEDVA